MKECRKIKKLLSRYLDKKTSDIDNIFVEKHLDICDICNKEYMDLLEVKQLMMGKERKSLPKEYMDLLEVKQLMMGKERRSLPED